MTAKQGVVPIVGKVARDEGGNKDDEDGGEDDEGGRSKRIRTMTPNTLVAVETSPFPVPLSFAGNSSGEIA